MFGVRGRYTQANEPGQVVWVKQRCVIAYLKELLADGIRSGIVV